MNQVQVRQDYWDERAKNRDLYLSRKRRTNYEVIIDILNILKKGSIFQQSLINQANLTHTSLKKYSPGMITKGYILKEIQRKNSIIYSITQSGLEFLDQLLEIDILLQEVVS